MFRTSGAAILPPYSERLPERIVSRETPHPRPVVLHAKPEGEAPKRRRRRKRRRFTVPAWIVFGVSAALGLGAAGLVYLRGGLFLVLSVVAFLWLLVVLIIDERAGFTRSRRLRRSGEVRVNFTKLEVAVLFALLLLNVFLGLRAWI